jgi:hypothetical protein
MAESKKRKATPKVQAVPKEQLQYDVSRISDAPQFHELSRAMGLLTWGIWDPATRPVEERIKDFVSSFPPKDPTARLQGFLTKRDDGSYAPSERGERAARFGERSWRPGTLFEMLARYGLQIEGAPASNESPFAPASFKETARRRNMKLRVLHGGVDIEPADMDAAKAEFLDRQEKQRAAQEIRAARQKMAEDLKSPVRK